MEEMMSTVYIPNNIKDAWEQCIALDREHKLVRATAMLFDEFVMKGGSYVPLVATGGSLRRQQELGVPALGLAKGGVDRKDRNCPIRGGKRESEEETGIVAERRYVRHLAGPFYAQSACSIDRMTLLRKGYKWPGKAFYSIHVRTYVEELPPHQLQAGEIYQLEWVSSYAQYKELTEGSPIREFLLETARRAAVWEDTS